MLTRTPTIDYRYMPTSATGQSVPGAGSCKVQMR